MSEKITADLAKWSMSEISKDALNSIRFRCEARMPFQASEVLPLIAEVERLREKCDDLTVNGFQAKLKQLDEAKKEVERLQAEVKRLKEVVAGYFGAGQRIQDLSDDCGLLEESNKALRAEVERLRGERDQALAMLAEWCVAAYRAGPLRKLLDAAIAKVRKDNGYEPKDTWAGGGA